MLRQAGANAVGDCPDTGEVEYGSLVDQGVIGSAVDQSVEGEQRSVVDPGVAVGADDFGGPGKDIHPLTVHGQFTLTAPGMPVPVDRTGGSLDLDAELFAAVCASCALVGDGDWAVVAVVAQGGTDLVLAERDSGAAGERSHPFRVARR